MRLIILLLATAISANFVYAQGANSSTVKANEVEKVFTDKFNHLIWSKALRHGEFADNPNDIIVSGGGFGWFSHGYDPEGNYDVEGNCNFEGLHPTEPGYDLDCRIPVRASAASKACHDLGGRLPTKQEWQSLLKNFDHTEYVPDPNNPEWIIKIGDPILTDKGRNDMQAVFEDMAPRITKIPGYSGPGGSYPDVYEKSYIAFWSSSAGAASKSHSYVFIVERHIIGFTRRDANWRVRCVFDQP